MADLLDTHLYALVGEDGFHRLIAAFYQRIATDDILGPMYPKEDLSGAEYRLREFLIQRFGGPDRYSTSPPRQENPRPAAPPKVEQPLAHQVPGPQRSCPHALQ